MILKDKDVEILAHIMDHFTDYMGFDDRPDHGFGILQGYRECEPEERKYILMLTGRLMRARKRIREKKYKNEKNNQ